MKATSASDDFFSSAPSLEDRVRSTKTLREYVIRFTTEWWFYDERRKVFAVYNVLYKWCNQIWCKNLHSPACAFLPFRGAKAFNIHSFIFLKYLYECDDIAKGRMTAEWQTYVHHTLEGEGSTVIEASQSSVSWKMLNADVKAFRNVYFGASASIPSTTHYVTILTVDRSLLEREAWSATSFHGIALRAKTCETSTKILA